MNREVRKIQHTKTKTIKVVEKAPLDSEGTSGDIRLSSNSDGVILYAKYKNAWYYTVLTKVR